MRLRAGLLAVTLLKVTAVHAQGTGDVPTAGAGPGASTPVPAGGAGQEKDASAPGATPAAPSPAASGSGGFPPCLFVGPAIGSSVLDLGLTVSSGPSLVPSIRVGALLPKGFWAGEAGLQLQTSPATGYGQFSFKLGGVYGLDLGSLGPMKTYGVGGLDANLLATISSYPTDPVPFLGLNLAAGARYSIDKNWSVGCELGLRTTAELASSGLGLSTGVFVSMTGSWCPGECPYSSGSSPPSSGPEGPVYTPDPDTVATVTPDIVTHNDSQARPCSVFVTDGWMEPTQGVWQDDISFEDKPGKQLTRLEGDAVAYLAELPMVTRKATLMFGVHHYLRAGAPVTVDSRDFIVLSGMTNCTTPKPVTLRFFLNAMGGGRTLWTSPEIGQVKLTGPAARDYEPWSVRLPVRQGVPPDNVFTIDQAGGYQVRAELLDAGNPTGLVMSVGGQALDMQGPAVHFVPVMLNPTDEAGVQTLRSLTELMERDSATRIPDFFPLAPGGLPTTMRVVRSLTNVDVPGRWFRFRRISYLVAALNDTLAASAFLTGAGRVVASMSGPDFRSVFGTGAAGMTVEESVEVRPRGQSGRTLSWKVMLVPSFARWDTVAHELLHTLPEGWAGDEMRAECGRAYHNEDDPLAHGERITEESVPSTRDRKAGMISLMGPEVSESRVWMDQCTYWHLTRMLAGGPPDPPVTLVRAMIGRQGRKLTGELRPVYDLGGSVDLMPGGRGPFAFVFRDATGGELARFSFEPRATDIETKVAQEVMSYVGRAPVVPGWAQLELVAAGGLVLDKLARSEVPPRVVIDAPGDGELVTPEAGKVKVRWTATSASPLLSSVLYSSDGGSTWTDQAFEDAISELEVALKPKVTEHLVKVVVTDRTRSGEAVIRFRTPAEK